MKLTIPVLFLSVCLGTAAATAQNAAAQLRGKSVLASWTEERLQRLGGVGEFTQRSLSHQLSAYISSEGRVFAKRVVFGGKRGRSGDANSVGDAGSGSQHAHISGRTLVVTTQFRGGARLVRIEFSSDFSSCTANVILGRENGAGIAHGHSLINGRALEIKEAHVSNASCSLREGNVFAQ